MGGKCIEYMVPFARAWADGASNILVVGDFRNYVIVDRAGMNLELVPHLVDVTNNRPTGQRGWFATWRVGSDVTNADAFRVLKL